MRIRVVDSGEQVQHGQSILMSYVINDCVAIDAGAIGLIQPLADQKRIHTIFLTHSHADHIATLPFFVDNVFVPGPDCVRLYASRPTIQVLEQHVFNDRIWPDVARLAQSESPFITFEPIEAGKPVEVAGIRVTPFDTDHVIPTLGFLLEDENSAVAMVADTAPVDDLWQMLAGVRNLRAVFLEVSFPNSMQWLAEKSKHLTPTDFAGEVAKLQRDVDWHVIHVKANLKQQVTDEIQTLNLPRCSFAETGIEYVY